MRSASQGAPWNERYLAARNFLTHQLHRACAGFLPPRPTARWSDALVFLDVDGVFDCELLGFPHATVSGLTALALLQAQGFAVVLNTGRSVEHVREYCRTYGDRKSTRLNSSHGYISYAVFCLKKKKDS